MASRAVTEIRQIYGRYEFVMYGADMAHVYLTPNGFPRGVDKQYFDAANFGRLTEDEQATACRIPFSQPKLLLPILPLGCRWAFAAALVRVESHESPDSAESDCFESECNPDKKDPPPYRWVRPCSSVRFIWTLSIVADLRRCGDLFVRLILATPTRLGEKC